MKTMHQITPTPVDSLDKTNLSFVGSSAVGDSYERAATFSIAPGSTTVEAVIGRVIFPGSAIGLSAELTEARTAGSVTVNLKINAVTAITLTLDGGSPTSLQNTAAVDVNPVAADDAITVEVITVGYDNAGSVPSGLAINLTLSSTSGSVALAITVQDEGVSVPNTPHTQLNFTGNGVLATDTGGGVTEINIPGAVTERFRYTAGGAAASSDFMVTLPSAMPDDSYIVKAQLVDASSIMGIRCPDALLGDRTTTEFRVILTAPLATGETIDFLVTDRDSGDDQVGP
jgi:hypothetical protein